MNGTEETLAHRGEVMGRAALKALGFDEKMAAKIKQRIDEGLDAVSVKVFQYEGTVVADEPRVDYDARHKYVELGSKLFDWHPSKIEHEVHGEVGITIIGFDSDGV